MAEWLGPPDFTKWTQLKSHYLVISLVGKDKKLDIFDVPLTGKNTDEEMKNFFGYKFSYTHPQFPGLVGEMREYKCGAKVAHWGFEGESYKWITALYKDGEWRLLKEDEKMVYRATVKRADGSINVKINICVLRRKPASKHWEVEVIEV